MDVSLLVLLCFVLLLLFGLRLRLLWLLLAHWLYSSDLNVLVLVMLALPHHLCSIGCVTARAAAA